MSAVDVFQRVRLRGGRVVQPGRYSVGREVSAAEVEELTTYPGWARMLDDPKVSKPKRVAEPVQVPQPAAPEPAALPGNDALFDALFDMSGPDREGYWDRFTVEQLNEVLRERFGEEIKDRPHGTAANMIEKRLGL